jgi:hypothetical protein
MITEQERHNKADAREHERRRVNSAYHRLFNSPDGQTVLSDLIASFAWRHPPYIPNATRPGGPIQYDKIQGLLRSGQQMVFMYIENKLRADALLPEANLQVTTE